MGVQFLIIAAAATATATASAPPPPLPVESEARSIIEWQMASPPREDARLSPDEADAIHRLYLQSIGEKPDREISSGAATHR